MEIIILPPKLLEGLIYTLNELERWKWGRYLSPYIYIYPNNPDYPNKPSKPNNPDSPDSPDSPIYMFINIYMNMLIIYIYIYRYPDPIQPTIEATHENYHNVMTDIVTELSKGQRVNLMIASHNQESMEQTLDLMETHRIHHRYVLISL